MAPKFELANGSNITVEGPVVVLPTARGKLPGAETYIVVQKQKPLVEEKLDLVNKSKGYITKIESNLKGDVITLDGHVNETPVDPQTQVRIVRVTSS